ncbi:V-type proton ATPase subunit a [Aphelenchoides besseyi]|nr:V-type proton ATPase subunit a [Aphelenchoides besseyi]
MGSMLRSELMSLCQVFLQPDSAFISVAQLGELGICQFRDLNSEVSSYNRKYMIEVKRCDEMQRQIKMVEDAVNELNFEIPFAPSSLPAPLPRDMNDLENRFEKLEEELTQIQRSTKELKHNYLQLSNLKQGQQHHARQSISEAQHGFGPIHANGVAPGIMIVSDKEEKREESELKFIAGSINKDRVSAFERVLWRMTHGNVFMRTIDIEPEENAPFKEDERKAAFLLFFSGEQLRSRVRKICDGFRAQLIENCPDNAEQRRSLYSAAESRLKDMSTVINKTLEHRDRVLHAASLNLKIWEIQVLKLQAIFHTLNKFNLDITAKCLIAECWVPSDDIHRLRGALEYATEISGSNVSSVLNILHTHETPPTYHRTNKYTRAFQNIVDAYGIANYREINPAPWTIITFPFIFAVMFGDVGHGMIMFLSALALIVFGLFDDSSHFTEKKIEAARIKDEIFNTFYGGRYVIVLMGAFAIYTGFIYNDFFAKSFNIFGSGWKVSPEVYANLQKYVPQNVSIKDIPDSESWELLPRTSYLHSQGPYPFGLDPVWNLATNRLNFLNPMKMKSSVIIGVSQMLFGLMLSLFNHIHFKSTIDILFVFIPQLLFLSLIFIYLCVQIVLKWIFFWVTPAMVFGQVYPGPHCAPSLLIGLINMFMMTARKQGFVAEKVLNPDEKYTEFDQCYLGFWYPGEISRLSDFGMIEKAFLLIAVLCIPVMLFVKPILLWRKAKRGIHVEVHGHGGGDSGEFSFGDTMVYQVEHTMNRLAIHTIEFALGCISHTASYLRLWALSLAHAQLSEVLWTMVLRQGLSQKSYIGIIGTTIIFYGFAILSVAILVLMEGLSAFLHALRLHWVEFQSKFYGGDGINFEPFSFEQLIRIHEGFDA